MRDRSEDKIEIIFIRHAATKSNLQKRYVGKNNDEGISDEGKEVLSEKLNSHVYPDADLLFLSGKKRCIQTAEAIYPGQEKIIRKELDEIDFGDFEDKNYDELKDDERYLKWIESNGELPFPNGESKSEYCERNRKLFLEIMDDIKKAKKNNPQIKSVALVVHGGTIMSMISSFSDKTYYDCQVSNACGFICEVTLSEETVITVKEKI